MNLSKALVVDDSKVVRVMFKRMLEARGLGVDTAASGQEALDYLKTQAPDIIFMDYMMTGADGYEVTAMIAADPQTSAIPVIMCTANDTPKDRARADGCGAVGFLTKPIGEPALDSLLSELQQGIASAGPTEASAAKRVVETPVPASTEDPVRAAERIAHEVAERLVGQAMAALSATSDEMIRRVAEAAGTSAAQEALASWRAEAANTQEHAENAAMAAAERVARTILVQAAAEAETTRRATEKTVEERLHEALAAVSSTAERIARETLASADAGPENPPRQLPDAERLELEEAVRVAAETAARRSAEMAVEEKLRESLAVVSSTAERVARDTVDSARAALKDELRRDAETAQAHLQESVRIAAEAAARPVAENVARAMTEELRRNTLVATGEAEAALHGRLEQTAMAAAERIAKSIVQQGVGEVEAARRSIAQGVDEKLQAALAAIPSTAERIALDTLERSKTEIAEASRQILDAARADLDEHVRVAAEGAAKPVAEAAARSTVEGVARETLAAALAEEAASLGRVEQAAISVAERVGRELVHVAFSTAAAKGPTAAAEAAHPTEFGLAHGDESPARQDTAARAQPPASAVPRAVLPWLAGLTLVVLYLLVRGFL